MIERLTDLPEGIDGFRARGTVTRDDYDQTVVPILTEARSKGRRVRLLFHFGPDFDGFTAGAAWEDFRVGIRFQRFFERCVIVSDIEWIRMSSRVVGALLPCPVRIFGNEQFKEAAMWLAGPGDEIAMPHKFFADKGVLVLDVNRPLRSEDFDAIAMMVDPWIEANGTFRGIVLHSKELPTFEHVTSFIHHIRFAQAHEHKIHRLAFATGGTLTHLMPMVHKLVTESKVFDYNQLDDAIQWAAQPIEAS